MVKSLPASAGDAEAWVQSLGQEDALEKEMALHSSILAGKIPWTEEPGGLPSMGSQSQTTEHTSSDVDTSDGASDRSGTAQALQRGFLHAGDHPGSI